MHVMLASNEITLLTTLFFPPPHQCQTVVAVLGPGFGILFSDFLTEMKASSTMTTAIFNSESFAWSVSNMLAGPLTEHFGWRAVGTVGGLACCLGMVASAHAPSASFLFFSHSVLLGEYFNVSTHVHLTLLIGLLHSSRPKSFLFLHHSLT